MNTFNTYTIETAPADSRPLLEGTKAAFGFLPNLQSFMAESPELLAGYSALWDLFSKSTLTPHEQQILAAGYTRRNVFEVILGVATKVMSNYTNHIVHTPYDAFMKGNEWARPLTAIEADA